VIANIHKHPGLLFVNQVNVCMCHRMRRNFEADVMYQDIETTQYELKYT